MLQKFLILFILSLILREPAEAALSCVDLMEKYFQRWQSHLDSFRNEKGVKRAEIFQLQEMVSQHSRIKVLIERSGAEDMTFLFYSEWFRQLNFELAKPVFEVHELSKRRHDGLKKVSKDLTLIVGFGDILTQVASSLDPVNRADMRNLAFLSLLAPKFWGKLEERLEGDSESPEGKGAHAPIVNIVLPFARNVADLIPALSYLQGREIKSVSLYRDLSYRNHDHLAFPLVRSTQLEAGLQGEKLRLSVRYWAANYLRHDDRRKMVLSLIQIRGALKADQVVGHARRAVVGADGVFSDHEARRVSNLLSWYADMPLFRDGGPPEVVREILRELTIEDLGPTFTDLVKELGGG